jgi:hypothetical protein
VARLSRAGIIRGRWEICCYQVNRGFTPAQLSGRRSCRRRGGAAPLRVEGKDSRLTPAGRPSRNRRRRAPGSRRRDHSCVRQRWRERARPP